MSTARVDLRPLDPVRSIKAKLGLLVVASTSATALAVWFGLVELGWYPRWTLPVAVLLALGVTQVLAHGMTRPLRQMTAASRAMAAGDYDQRVQASSRDEVGELARAFTTMAADLAAEDGRRRDLLANLGHELRTPVAAARAHLENLVDGVQVPDTAALTAALAQVERLGRLVDDLLDLASADAGAAPLQPTEVAVAPLLHDVADEAAAARPGPRWRVEVHPAGLQAYADPARLRQVVTNLADNAARHAGSTGTIRLAASPGGHGGVVVEVSDDGPGIPRAERERVFERFTRGGPEAGGTGGGTGLGLAIARWAVDLHGGSIGVVDDPVGCRIRVELPGRTR